MTTTPTPVRGTIAPLEWFSDRTAHSANTTFGQYRVADIHGRWTWFFEFIPVGGEDRIDKGHGEKNTRKSAQAAAQADYEARILAAIQPDPEPQPVAWRYRSVVKPTCWSNVTENRRTAYARIGMEEQPLYATPSSAGMVSVEAAARVLLDQPYSVMVKAFDAMESMQGEGEDRIMNAALRALGGERG